MSTVREEYEQRAQEKEGKIADYINNGIGFTPFGDMVVYLLLCTPKMEDSDLEVMDKKALEVIFDGDKDGDVTNRKLIYMDGGPDCKLGLVPGTQIAVRGNAFKVATDKGVFLVVREYDVIGKYE